MYTCSTCCTPYTLCVSVGMYRKNPCLGLKGVGLRVYSLRVED